MFQEMFLILSDNASCSEGFNIRPDVLSSSVSVPGMDKEIHLNKTGDNEYILHQFDNGNFVYCDQVQRCFWIDDYLNTDWNAIANVPVGFPDQGGVYLEHKGKLLIMQGKHLLNDGK